MIYDIISYTICAIAMIGCISMAVAGMQKRKPIREGGKNVAYDELRKNKEGYSDPTAYQALKNICKSEPADQRFHELLNTIFSTCEFYGFKLERRIVVTDLVSGKTYR